MRAIKYLFVISCYLALNYTTAADEFCVAASSCSTSDVECPYATQAICKEFTIQYYNDYGVASCTSCETGRELVLKNVSVPGCSNLIAYYNCELPCLECPDCESFDWTSMGVTSPYENKMTATCNYTTCTCSKRYSYRCKQGYYGTANLVGTDGCTRCPKFVAGTPIGGSGLAFTVYGSTPAAGNGYSITDCYVPFTYEYKDVGGYFIFSEDCFYSE